MKRIPQGRYSKEFREEAVKHVIEKRMSVPEASRRWDISKSTLSYWVKTSKAGNLESIGKNCQELIDVELELAKLRSELLSSFFKPLGVFEYVEMQMNTRCAIADSGTITEES